MKEVNFVPPIIKNKVCIKCGTCVQICPLDVLKFDGIGDDKQVIVKYPYECWHCRACVKDCPVNAISMRYPLSHLLLHKKPEEVVK